MVITAETRQWLKDLGLACPFALSGSLGELHVLSWELARSTCPQLRSIPHMQESGVIFSWQQMALPKHTYIVVYKVYTIPSLHQQYQN